MPNHHQHSSISPLSTFLIVAVLALALFPTTFVSIAWAPYNSLVRYAFPASARQNTNIYCASPNICTLAPTMSWYAEIHSSSVCSPRTNNTF